MPYDPPPDLRTLSAEAATALASGDDLPPVDQWQPTHTGDSGMRIGADGTWWHEGAPITRPAMRRAFARLLWRDADRQHWLVTPAQRLSIAVEDAAFRAVDVVRQNGNLVFRLDTDELVVACPDHPIRAQGDPDSPALYLGVRHRCEARLDRSTFAQLAELALDEGEDWHVTSGGERFSLVP